MPDENEEGQERSGLEYTGYRSGQVRIVGAEPARRSLEDRDEGPKGDLESWSTVPGPGTSAWEPDDEAPGAAGAGTELPHWTESPTGQIPAVLAGPEADRDDTSDPWSFVPAPTWREEHADWEAHEEAFEPSMLADQEARGGSLGDHDDPDRRPWEFDLPDSGGEATENGDPAGDYWPGEQTQVVAASGSRQDLPSRAEQPGFGPARGHYDEVGPGAPAAGFDDPIETVRVGAPGAGADELTEPGDGGGLAGGSVDTFLRGEPRVEEEEEGPVRIPGRRRVSDADAGARGSGSRGGRGAGGRRQPARGAGAVAGGLTSPEVASGRADRNLGLASLTGIVFGILALIAFAAGPAASAALVTVVVTLAAAEAFAALRRGGYHPATLLGLAATIFLVIATYNKGLTALPLVMVLLVGFLGLWYMLGVERVDAIRGLTSTLLVFSWVGVFGSFGALLLDPTLFPDRRGIAFLLGAVITAVAYDVGALTFGAWLGRHPLAPSVSPNKTWEGAIGGGLTAIVIAVVVVHLIHPWTPAKAAALGVVVAVVAPIGDLFESLVKRHIGVKDMGRLLPGHGGILDRVDGLLFVLPATYYLVKALHLG